MSRSMLTTIGWMLTVLITSTNVHAVQLSEVIHYTLHTNPALKNTQANVDANRFQLRRSQGGYFPTVDLFGSTAREYSDTPGLRAGGITGRTLSRHESRASLRQLVFDGFEVSSDVAEKHHLLHRAEFELFDVQNELIFQTIRVYLNVLRTRHITMFAQRNVDAHLATLKKVNDKFKGGAGRRVDVELVKSRLGLARARLDTARGQQRIAEAEYFRVVGSMVVNPMDSAKLPFSAMPKTKHDAVDVALENNPKISQAAAAAMAAGERITNARSAFYPKVFLQLDGTADRNIDGIKGRRGDASVALVGSYNLFNGGSDHAEYHRTQAQHSQALFILEDVQRQVVEAVQSAWADMTTSRARIGNLKDNVHATKRVVDDYTIQFEMGKRQLFNVLDEQNNLFLGHINLTNARIDYELSFFRILADLGRLTQLYP